MSHHSRGNRRAIGPKPAGHIQPAPARPTFVANRLDRKRLILKLARAIHPAVTLHYLLQIELRCDLRDIAVTVIVGSIDSPHPHTLFLGRLERITVNHSRIINENGRRLPLPPLPPIEHTSAT